MKLITETIEDAKVVITEEKNGKKSVCTLKVLFLQGEIKNRNGRMYPSNIG